MVSVLKVPEDSARAGSNSRPGVFKLNFELDNPQFVSINIYDITGHNIEQVMDKILSAGENDLYIDISHLPSGIYIIKVVADEEAVAKKIILVN